MVVKKRATLCAEAVTRVVFVPSCVCGSAQPDPPFKPVGRRNEVWLHLSKTEDEVLQKAQTTTS